MVNVNSTVQHVIQINIGIMNHVNANLKTIKRAKKILVGVLMHIFKRTVSI